MVSHEYTASPATTMAPSQPMEPSTKRKLSARDDDDPPIMADEPGKQRSQLNRRGSELRISDNGPTKSMSSEIMSSPKPRDQRV